jgi:hypothetical protein
LENSLKLAHAYKIETYIKLFFYWIQNEGHTIRVVQELVLAAVTDLTSPVLK